MPSRKRVKKQRIKVPMRAQAGFPQATQSILDRGREQARRVVQHHGQVLASFAAAAMPSKGTLVLEGDSWFDYPAPDFLTTDLSEELAGMGYRVESDAHHGDVLEAMAYEVSQTRRVERLLRRLNDEGRRPRAILLSAGGNDLAGTLFEVLLDHKRSLLPVVNETVCEGVINQRLRAALLFWIGVVDELAAQLFGSHIPIVLHGYDYAIPDGRGVFGGWWILPGPWLSPGFVKKGHTSIDTRLEPMNRIMDLFNTMLMEVASSNPIGAGNVVYVDLRNTLPRAKYKDWWANELHPTERGFAKVAKVLDKAISKLP